MIFRYLPLCGNHSEGPMDVGAILSAIFDNSAVTALIGVMVGALIENLRRVEERRQRHIERERDAISALQFGLIEASQGGWLAQLVYAQGEARAGLLALGGEGAEGVIKALPDLSAMGWYQDWLASIRKVNVMLARIGDPELQRLANEALRLSSEIQGGSFAEFEKRFPELEKATVAANERAGQLYRELGGVNRPPRYRPWGRKVPVQLPG